MWWKGLMTCCRNMHFGFSSDALIYSFRYNRGKSKFPLWSISNATNLFKMSLLIVIVLLQCFHRWLPQTQGLIRISLDHQLCEITIITSFPLVISYHVSFGIWIGIIFVGFSLSIHGQSMMFILITWIQYALSLIPSHKNISRQYCRGQKGHLLICIRYSTFSLTMKCFRKSLTSMCFGISCYHKCTAYEIWWTCRKDGRLIAYRIWKETFLHRYRCLSHLTFPIHLSVATTNTAFVYVFSPLEYLMWNGYCSQGWWKRNLADPWHSPIKQTKFRLHVFFIRSSSIKDSTEICGKNKKQQY